MYLLPAILTGSTETAQQQLKELQDDVQVDTVHFDIIDGYFVDNITITPADIAELDLGKFECDLHFMVEEPLDFVYELVEFKDRIPVRAVIAQIEKMTYQKDYLLEVRNHGFKAGLSLDLHTPLEAVDDTSWPLMECVQLMAVEAGYQGQPMNPSIFFKLQELRQLLKERGLHPEIIVDGGVQFENIAKLRDADVESVVIGSGLWEKADEDKAILQLWSEANLE